MQPLGCHLLLPLVYSFFTNLASSQHLFGPSSDLVQNHVFPALDTKSLSAISSTNQMLRRFSRPELCRKAEHHLFSIITMASKTLYDFNPLSDDILSREYSRGFHFYFTETNGVDLSIYLKLFLMSDQMSMHRLIQMRTEHDMPSGGVLLLDSVTHFLRKSYAVRHWMVSNKCIDSDLQRKLNEIRSGELMQIVLEHLTLGKNVIAWNGTYLESIWRDMEGLIQKDMLRILMNDTNNGFGIEFTYNDNVLMFMEEIANIRDESDDDAEALDFCSQLTDHLMEFMISVHTLYDDVKLSNGYKIKLQPANVVNSLIFELGKYKEFQQFLECAKDYNGSEEAWARRYLGCIKKYSNLHVDVITAIGRTKAPKTHLNALQSLKFTMMLMLTSQHNSSTGQWVEQVLQLRDQIDSKFLE